MKRSVRYSTLTAALVAGSMAHGAELPNYNAALINGASASAVMTRRGPVAAPRAVVASTDARTGVPRFVWAPAGHAAPQQLAAANPESAARAYLREHAGLYGLMPAALETAQVAQVHDIGRGAIVVTLRQNVDGVEVFHNDLKVVLRRNLELVALSGSLHPSAVKGLKRGAEFKVAAPAALARALQDLHGVAVKGADMVDRKETKGGYLYFDLAATPAVAAGGLSLTRPARVKRVFFPMGERLVPAYYLELRTGTASSLESDAYAYVIAADDGRLLYRENQTHNAFNYRVWAEAQGLHVPLDGPQANFTPHPTALPDGSSPPFIAPILVSTDGFNTNTNGVVDPWLPVGATETSGNNVDAYSDHNAPDGFSDGDLRATTTAPGTFDHTYSTSLEPESSAEQVMAAVTQIFFVTNFLHDWYYDSGFNEAAGNGQVNNFGRGGVDGDPLLAEAQDGSGTNNANMNTGADGESPRMQMYVWDGVGSQGLAVSPLGMNLTTGAAAFGPDTFTVTGQLALADDGTAPTSDGCQPLGASMAGKIALMDRGTCSFVEKVVNAQSAGALGVIVANTAPHTGLPPLGGDSLAVTTPVLGISEVDGNTLKAALLSGAQNVTLTRQDAVTRDGTIDNTIVAHEWGHYIHLRQVACGSAQCGAQSEGWGDFIALQMVLREGDDLHGVFPLSVYSTAALGDAYYGIRRVPYSVDFGKNALSFRHISDGEPLPDTHPILQFGNNAEVHSAGEIWATMLFEAYVALIESAPGGNRAHTFSEAKRLMSDYIVAGMKLAPVSPTYTEQRDAILAAASASNEDDFLALAGAFARRGAGTCAVSPPTGSTTFAGVVEDFNNRPNVAFVSAKLDDSIISCDDDGLLDGEETGKVTLQIINTGTAPLVDAQATVSTQTGGVQFPNGAAVDFGTIAPFTTGTATVDIALDGSFTQIEDLTLNLEITSPSSCVTTQTQVKVRRVNLDDTPASSSSDNVESESLSWETTGADAHLVWAREQVTPSNHLWHGVDLGGTSDTSIESPSLDVGQQDFILSFTHRYKFEYGGDTFWDGSVIEVSQDDGASWVDISTFGDPGYGGVIGDEAGNPLGGRQGYVNQSPSWPGTNNVSINLGTALAGETVKIRFRIGTDAAVGDAGWEIDDLNFQGITNTPFAEISTDAGACSGTPIADAGPDQTVQGGDAVALDASGSSDPEGDALTFTWAQVAGPSVMLADADTANPGFTAPVVTADTTITLQVQVSDGQSSSSDQVNILVQSGEGTPPIGSEDGCDCTVAGDSNGAPMAPLAPLAAAAALLFRRRRRS